MGTRVVHYVVLGVCIDKKKDVLRYFETVEDTDEIYTDNPYIEAISHTKSGLHVIADGMNCEYVVAGKILAKAVNDGLPLVKIPPMVDPKLVRDVKNSLAGIDKHLGTKFQDMQIGCVAFSHWH